MFPRFTQVEKCLLAKYLMFPPLTQAESCLLAKYRAEMWRVHAPLARPMTRHEIITEAQARGIDVTEANFNSIYRYEFRPKREILVPK